MSLCQRPCYSAIRIDWKTHPATPAAFRGIHAHSADRSALAGGQRPTKRCPFAFLSAIPSCSWLLHRAIEERYDLGSRAVVAGTEQAVADTTGNAVLLRPSNRRRVVSVRGHVQEGGITAHGRAAVGAPQEGDRLRSRAVAVGVEGHSAGAAGDALLNRP